MVFIDCTRIFIYIYDMKEKEFKYKEDGSIRLKKCFENAVSEMANEFIDCFEDLLYDAIPLV